MEKGGIGPEGPPKNFKEILAEKVETKIEADKIKNTHDNAVDLVKNNFEFFGAIGDKTRQSEIALRVLGRFGKGYENVAKIKADMADRNRTEKVAKADLESLTDSVIIAINMTVTGDELITDSMTAEQIEENLPEEMKGIGEEIVKRRESIGEDRQGLIEINQRIDEKELYTTRDASVRTEVYEKWSQLIKSEKDDSLTRQYAEVAMSIINDLGIVEASVAAAAEKMAGVMEDLTVDLSKFTTKLTTGDISRFVDPNELSESSKANLAKEVENPEMREGLGVAKGSKQIQKDAIEGGAKSRKTKAQLLKELERMDWDGTIGDLYAKLDFIEEGTRSVDDLSTNSEKFRILYKAQNGDYDNLLLEQVYNGIKIGEDELVQFKQELGMRMFLHSLNLAASKCSSIEDIMRVVSTMHEGDIDGDLDKLLLSVLLKNHDGKRKGVGLGEIPVDLAWNLRQDGYFKINDLLSFYKKDKITGKLTEDKRGKIAEAFYDKNSGFRKHLEDVGLYSKFEHYIDPKNGDELGFDGLFIIDTELEENDKFAIPEDMYKNFFLLERSAGEQAKLIKEYMLWKIMQEKKCDKKKAEKAFDLAHKLSVATFSDSPANIAFAQDDYAEIINFKLLRYADGPRGGKGRMSKNKGIGSPDTIGYINSLTCHWMSLLRKNDAPIATVNDPLYVEDIDLRKYTAVTAMPYHFFGVVGSQVVFVKEAFFDKFTPKDVLAPNYLNKVFSKINKTTYDMCRAKIAPIYTDKEHMNYYGTSQKEDGLYSKDSEIKGQAEAKVAEEMRRVWVLNTLRMATDSRSGWTSKDVDKFIEVLYYSAQIIDKNTGKGTSFISRKSIEDVVKMSRVRSAMLFSGGR